MATVRSRLVCEELLDDGDRLELIAAHASGDLALELATVVARLVVLQRRAADLQTALWLRTEQVRRSNRSLGVVTPPN